MNRTSDDPHRHDLEPGRPLPVTVLSGFLGAGKTSVIKHVLNNRAGLRVAVIVNDMAEINIDVELLRSAVGGQRIDEHLIEMTNGCICCTLRDDLLHEVSRLAKLGRFDYLLIESTGISEPMPVAATFTFEDDDGECLADVARLDTMVTVVDAERFWKDCTSGDDLHEREIALDGGDDRTVVDLLIEQVEFADVLLINKCDRVPEGELDHLEAVLAQLNPGAKRIRAEYGRVPLDEILNTERFDFDDATDAAGWSQAILKDQVSEADEFGIHSFVYRARRPFDAQRFADFVDRDWPGVLRAKGFFWLATRFTEVGLLSRAADTCRLEPAGYWYAAIPEEHWIEDEYERREAEAVWEEPYGDRRQELVFIGINMDEAALITALDDCLLSDADYVAGPDAWAEMPDPLPEWESDEDDDTDPPADIREASEWN